MIISFSEPHLVIGNEDLWFMRVMIKTPGRYAFGPGFRVTETSS